MNINELFHLPAHPLLVHVPVVMVPLALFTTLLALWPRGRRAATLAAAVLALVAAVGVVLATGSGEELEARVPPSPVVEAHTLQGDATRRSALAFGVVAVAAAAIGEVARRRAAPMAVAGTAPADGRDGDRDAGPRSQSGRRGPVATGRRSDRGFTAAALVPVAALAISALFGTFATTAVLRAGHSGARAVWHDTPAAARRRRP